MSYFTVSELMKIVDLGVSYALPKSISSMLYELETKLDITDSAPETNSGAPRRAYTDSASFSRQPKRDSSRGGFGLSSSSAASSRNKKDYNSSTGEWIDVKSTAKVAIGGAKPQSDPDWETMRSFKATKIESKTGIEKTVNDVRVALNKISVANYEKQKNAVLGFVSGYFNGPDANINDNDTSRISKAIFDIASTNKFYSEIYAKLYNELISVAPVFRNLLDEFVDGFTNMSCAPIYVDPDVDYDGFCVYSKACDIRKSTSTFLVNCLKIGLIFPEQISAILFEFVSYVEMNIQDESFVKLAEEVIENVFIIATSCQSELKSTAKWNDYVLPTVSRFATQKNEGLKGLSSRAAFKCMDLIAKV